MVKKMLPDHSVPGVHQQSATNSAAGCQRSVPFLFKLYCQAAPIGAKNAGFTLIELLVAVIIGSILTTVLLFSAVQLMGTNQRESSRSDTQREVQSALDYIARDLREAIYVYDGECLNPNDGQKIISQGSADTCSGLLRHLPLELNSPTNLPVLAFWRVDPLPEPQDRTCRSTTTARQLLIQRPANSPPRDIDELNCGAKRMYTLVVYSLNTDNPTTSPRRQDKTWKGRARITRYQLPKYTYGGGNTITPGWMAPDGTESTFLTWPRAGQNGVIRPTERILPDQPPSTRARYWDNKVLVDYIDGPVPGRPVDNTPVQCPAAPIIRENASSNPAGFIQTPSPTAAYAATTISRNIFYACVRGAGTGNLNQEVLVRIRANAAGRAGLDVNATEVPLTMETRVLTRGVVGKDI